MGNSACCKEAAALHQLSSPDSPIEVNDVHEYYSILNCCCDSHLHTTIKSPGRCPPMGGNKSAACQGRGSGSHQNEFSKKKRKSWWGFTRRCPRLSPLSLVICKGEKLGCGREAFLSCEFLPFHTGELSRASLQGRPWCTGRICFSPRCGKPIMSGK